MDRVDDRDESIIPESSTRGNMSLNEVVCVVAAEEYADAKRRCNLSGKDSDMRERYWSYLFDNLHRAVDEIYCTCETDESIVECQVRDNSFTTIMDYVSFCV